MRIISGIYGGRKLNLKIPPGVRPTQDSVKESIFNTLGNYIDFDDINVVDICAGTGSLAFEALSRGAKFATMVDASKKVCDFIKDYASKLNIPKENYKIVLSDALKFVKGFNNEEFEKIDLLFTDPPYSVTFLDEMIDIISQKKLLRNEGLIVIEHSKNQGVIVPNTWELLKEKYYGETIVQIHQINY